MAGEVTQGVISIAVGLGLAAACGFRVFVPLLLAGAAARWGNLPLASGFQWLASLPAILALATALLLEIGAYYVPWLDHTLDLAATPAAVLAGMLASASVVTSLPPMLKWAVALIGGGGVAGLIQGASVLFRLKSTALTGGLGNPVLATLELGGSVLTAAIALLLPLVALALTLVLAVLAFRATHGLLFRRHAAPPSPKGGVG
jgi:hypothetical protein